MCLILITYLVIYVIKYGIPPSISATYYKINNKLWFSICLISTSVLLFPVLVQQIPEGLQFLVFLTLGSVIFVGLSPNYRNSVLINNIHTISAYISLVCSQILVGLINPNILLIWILLFIYWIYYSIKFKSIKYGFSKSNIKFWGEVIMMITLCLL